MERSKKILKGGVIGTLMSNIGLENFLKKKKLIFKDPRLEIDMLKKK